jgi:hypothetical protein
MIQPFKVPGEAEMREAMLGDRPGVTGIFRDHNCAYCDSGKKPCRQGHPNRCDYPHARND